MKTLCIYHADCADGLGAAWAAHRALGDDVEFVAAKYGDAPPLCEDRDVLIVDFSYPLPVLRAMAGEARSVLVLDHHKTAQEDLQSIICPLVSWEQWMITVEAYPRTKGFNNLAAIFDLGRSGAGLAWDYLSPGQPRPRILDLIEDRDLWRFKYGDESRAFHAVLTSYNIADLSWMLKWLDNWNEQFELSLSEELPAYRIAGLKECGMAILRAQQQSVRAAVAVARRTIKIAGYVVPCANVPPSMASEAGHLLCDEAVFTQKTVFSTQISHIFTATYYDGLDRRHFSLRSPAEGADVGAIAKQVVKKFNRWANYSVDAVAFKPFREKTWAGGGHAHAAGFDAPLGWEGE